MASNALDISRATKAVRLSGLSSFNPMAILVTIGNNAVVVLCIGQYPCCDGALGKASVMYGTRSLSRIFIHGDSREMGLKLVLDPASFPGLGTGMMFARFQMTGMSALANDKLKSLVRKTNPRGPRNFKCNNLSPSGPKAEEFKDLRIATLVISTEKGSKA
jgi:hypothetical protein